MSHESLSAEGRLPAREFAGPTNVGRIYSLDGLRGGLALFVVCYHMLNSLPPLKEFLASWTAVLGQGWVAVDVFFALSGFVMCHVYQRYFAGGVGGADWLKFMQARMARLYPVHIATLAILFVVLLPFMYDAPMFLDANGRYSWQSAVASVFMLQGPWWSIRTWNYPAWSISVEWHLYIIFPFLVGLMVNRVTSVISVVVLPILIVFIYISLLNGQGLALSLSDYEPFPTNGPVSLIRGFLMFVVGMGVFSLRDVRLFASNTLAAFVTVFFAGLLNFSSSAPFAVLLIAPLILVCIHNPMATYILERKVALFLGRISYSLYMVHALVQIVIVNRVNSFLGEGEPLLLPAAVGLFAVAVALSILAGAAMHYWVELPFRSMLLSRSISPPK